MKGWAYIAVGVVALLLLAVVAAGMLHGESRDDRMDRCVARLHSVDACELQVGD